MAIYIVTINYLFQNISIKTYNNHILFMVLLQMLIFHQNIYLQIIPLFMYAISL